MGIMEVAVRDHLLADPDVSELVSTRIYPGALPQAAIYPAIRYQRVDTVRVYSKAGYEGDSRPRLQIDCWAETYLEAKRLADAVRTAMDGFPEFAVCENEQDGYEPDPAPPVYRVILDFSIWHREE